MKGIFSSSEIAGSKADQPIAFMVRLMERYGNPSRIIIKLIHAKGSALWSSDIRWRQINIHAGHGRRNLGSSPMTSVKCFGFMTFAIFAPDCR
jgi:hypothetical protein